MLAAKILLTMLLIGYLDVSSGDHVTSPMQRLYGRLTSYWNGLPQQTKYCTKDETNGKCPGIHKQSSVCVISKARKPSPMKDCQACEDTKQYNYVPGPCPGQILRYLSSFISPVEERGSGDMDDEANNMTTSTYAIDYKSR